MIPSILMIGAQGMLGRPVARRLVKDGFNVKALARNPQKAAIALPSKIEWIKGNLQDIDSIDQALSGCSALYVTVDTPPAAKFKPESDGLKNAVTAAKNHPGIRLIVLSALGSSNPDAAQYPWEHAREKVEAQQIAIHSGFPWTILEPTWFMESLPLFVMGKRLGVVSGIKIEPYWVAGDDMGKMISKILGDNTGIGEIIPVQGTKKIPLAEAAREFIAAYDSSIKTFRIPFWTLNLLSPLNAQLKEFVSLLKFCSDYNEPNPNPEIWNCYGKPSMTIADYAAYSRKTGDFPSK